MLASLRDHNLAWIDRRKRYIYDYDIIIVRFDQTLLDADYMKAKRSESDGTLDSSLQIQSLAGSVVITDH